MPANRRLWLAALIALLTVQGAIYALIIPPLQSPDEPQHLNNLILVANAGRPVTESDRGEAVESAIGAWMERVHYWYYRWEPVPDPLPTRLEAGIRPPLYYLLVGGLATPFQPRTPADWLAWGRAVSVLLTVATAALVCLAVAELYPEDSFLPLVSAAFVGLLPLQAYLGASVSSDNLANFLAGSLFYLMARGLRHGLSPVRIVGLGALLIASFGAVVIGSFLTKLSTLFLVVPAVAIVPLVLWARWPDHPSRRRRIIAIAAPVVVFLAGAGLLVRFAPDILWYLQNRVLYPGMIERALSRDFTSPAFWQALIAHAGTVYRQFWGSFGWLTIELAPGWYAAATVLIALALLGALGEAVGSRQIGSKGTRVPLSLLPTPYSLLLTHRARRAFVAGLIVWLLASLATFVGLFAFSADAGGGVQGRYLLPDLAPIAFLLALGWRSIVPAAHRGAGAALFIAWFACFNLGALLTAIIPAFYLSPNA